MSTAARSAPHSQLVHTSCALQCKCTNVKRLETNFNFLFRDLSCVIFAVAFVIFSVVVQQNGLNEYCKSCQYTCSVTTPG